tara:strand:- start:519 stop:1220 length:702 start_codon:yes stop_codon:yes gene_type:complete
MALPKLSTPKYHATVPSTGKDVEFRPYLVKEEKMLMIAAESQDERQIVGAMKDLIDACTFGIIDITKLTMFDLEYLFIKLRSKSVGETSKVGLKCSSCETQNEVTFSLESIAVAIDKDADMNIDLSDGVGISMRYPGVNDVLDMGGDLSDVDKMMGMVRSCIDTIYTAEEVFNVKEQSVKEVDDFIDSLSSKQFHRIREFLEKMPAAEVHAEFNCESCGEKNETVIKGTANFF